MRLASIGIGCALIASVALNLWQWRREPAPADTRHVASHDAAVPAFGASSVLAGTCATQLADLGSRLAKADAELDRHLSPREAFDRSAPDPVREAPVHDALAKLLADAPKGWSWQLECRGATCKLDVVEHDGGDPYDWMAKMRDGALHDQVDGMGFMAAVPSQDPTTKEPLVTHTAFMQLVGVTTVSGTEILERIVARFHADLGRGVCPSDESGFLSLQLGLDASARHVDVAAGGTLAVEPVGTCMLHDLDAAIAAEPIPDNARSAMVYDSVELPLSDTNRSRRSDDRRLARAAHE